MTSFDFWFRWLLVASLFLTLLGIVIATASNSFLFHPHIEQTAVLFYSGHLTSEALELRSFLFGPIGGTIAGYFFLQSLIVYYPFRNREPWAWMAVAGALLLWFCTDSAVSLYHGAWFNVWMVNLPTLIFVGLPLMMTARSFSGKKQKGDPVNTGSP